MDQSEIHVGRKYRMADDRVLHVNHMWDAPADHRRVGFEVIEGDHSRLKDMSLNDFAAQAVQEA